MSLSIRGGIRAKLIIGTILALLLFSLMVFLYINSALERHIMDNVRQEMTARSYEIQQYLFGVSRQYGDDMLDESNLTYLEHSLETRHEGMRIWLYGAEGPAGGEQPFYLESNYGDRIETIEKSQERAARAERSMVRLNSDNFSYPRLIMHFPYYDDLEIGAEISGIVGLEYELSEEHRLLERLRLVLILAFTALVVFTGAFLYFYITRMISPLETLKQAIERYQKGEERAGQPAELDIEGQDEIGELARAFKNMRSGIDELIADLRMEKEKQKEFFEKMTHELKTPLTIIRGFADMYDKVDTEEERSRCLDRIRLESDRMLEMVENLLSSSRSGNYSLEIEPEPVSLVELCRRTVDLIEVKALSRDIEMLLDFEDQFAGRSTGEAESSKPAAIDPVRIKEVLLNLLDNAITYSGTDIIKLSLRRREDGGCEIIIRDEGCGIKRSKLEKIENGELSRGQGLDIARRIVDLHGGELELNSSPDRGTTARIILPASVFGGESYA
ncbi:sensor histidine kinase [Halarsenatibacter silvermanii]|uniref:histidine kinase n=1 Tax=Halarsenatibacter silvermanii TaxID=321763 RepID=A0A1G9QFQ6_9FIRM|nr:HAMP domain-containing sensor histidine kinase [Halarsenatibacter silvermanii]SDM09720.1 Signal transduction histidine kinase [Halarsenatibacter silvermanii]